MRCLWIVGEVGVDHRRRGTGNSWVEDRRSHKDDLAQELGGFRSLGKRERDIGHRADRAESDLARVLLRHANDQVAGVLVGRLDLRRRKLNAPNSIAPVDVIGAADIWMNERARNAFRHRNARATKQLEHPQRILG